MHPRRQTTVKFNYNSQIETFEDILQKYISYSNPKKIKIIKSLIDSKNITKITVAEVRFCAQFVVLFSADSDKVHDSDRFSTVSRAISLKRAW